MLNVASFSQQAHAVFCKLYTFSSGFIMQQTRFGPRFALLYGNAPCIWMPHNGPYTQKGKKENEMVRFKHNAPEEHFRILAATLLKQVMSNQIWISRETDSNHFS